MAYIELPYSYVVRRMCYTYKEETIHLYIALEVFASFQWHGGHFDHTNAKRETN